MLYFLNDYSEGCCPEILEKLTETNYDKTVGYGEDEVCAEAAEKIKKAFNCPEGQVYFLAGGTQTNMMVIDTMTAPFEGVVACDTGHVNTHEAGAIEYTGHKVLTIKGKNGKLEAAALKQYIVDYYNDGSHEHMVKPGIVYISHPTEYGTLYTKDELIALHEVCQEYELPLYCDGARLAYGVCAKGTDVTFEDLAKYTDVFYVGGTKCGALYGEAVVFTKGNMPKLFNTRVKQHGAMLAKGRLLGVQFDALFTEKNGITPYIKGGQNAIKLAEIIKKALKKNGYKFYLKSPTNQIFVIMDNGEADKLMEKVAFSKFEKYDDTRSVVRFVTSWATTREDVDEFVKILSEK